MELNNWLDTVFPSIGCAQNVVTCKKNIKGKVFSEPALCKD